MPSVTLFSRTSGVRPTVSTISLYIFDILIIIQLGFTVLLWAGLCVRLLFGSGLLAFEIGLAPFAFDNFVVLFAHGVYRLPLRRAAGDY